MQIMDFKKTDLYEVTDSMYIENTHWDRLDKAGSVGRNSLQAMKN